MDGGNLSLTCDGKAGSEGISISLLELGLSRSTKSRYFVFGFYFVDKYEGNVQMSQVFDTFRGLLLSRKV